MYFILHSMDTCTFDRTGQVIVVSIPTDPLAMTVMLLNIKQEQNGT